MLSDDETGFWGVSGFHLSIFFPNLPYMLSAKHFKCIKNYIKNITNTSVLNTQLYRMLTFCFKDFIQNITNQLKPPVHLFRPCPLPSPYYPECGVFHFYATQRKVFQVFSLLYKWHHSVCILLQMVFGTNTYSSSWLVFNAYVLFCHLHIPQFIYPFFYGGHRDSNFSLLQTMLK